MANDEWYTPIPVLDAVVQFFGESIGFDPTCSPDSPAWEYAVRRLTKEDDALIMDVWPDLGPMFLNMPYSRPAPFVERAIEYALRGYMSPAVPVVTLTNASTSTRWCQDLLDAGDFACFASPRIRFWRPRLPPGAFGPEPVRPVNLLDRYPGPFAIAALDRWKKWKKKVDDEAALKTVYTVAHRVELVDPGSPRYENLITGFGGTFADFRRAFEPFGYCTELR